MSDIACRTCGTCNFDRCPRDDFPCDACLVIVGHPKWKPKEEEVGEHKEMVFHPVHYNQGKYEVIDVIYDWNLNFSLGSALKYIARLDTKEKPIEDLKKAIQYLEFEIQEREKINK